jgi:DEAD/DEAH box helicase domain-containing protein
MASPPIQHLLKIWSSEPTIRDNVVVWREEAEAEAKYENFPDELFFPLRNFLVQQKGITQLYLHQADAWREARSGKNIVVVSGTASGKTLCYNLPVLDHVFRHPESRALYLFPTKALTQDQYQGLYQITSWTGLPGDMPKIPVAVYDGDTPTNHRSGIRSNARLLLSNPDMLHTGILPHHTRWAEFFRNLDYVIIDEIHTYRGVFGSHVANVIRRLKRIAAFYGAYPQFFLTSATIGNPGTLAERLIELPVTVIDKDASPHGKRYFIFYNPPIIDPDLGIRAGSLHESIRLTSDLMDMDIQSLLFARARRTVEMMLLYLQQSHNGETSRLRAYRSGYLPKERREIEQSLRQGAARVVVATNALELGIDIGGMDAVILIGYPGTIASTRQQSGRAGRRHGESLSVLVASSNPVDQYLMQHPDFLFDRSPEQALINPDNLLILLQHLRCAAFELPFHKAAHFGNLSQDILYPILDLLDQSGEIYQSEGKYFWMSDKYPSEAVSLRSSSSRQVLLQVPGPKNNQTIGQVDYESAMWMVHPNAIYLQLGQMYEVHNLNLENNTAQLTPVEVDYFTEPKKIVDIEKISILKKSETQACVKYYGEVMVTTQVVGYRRIRWYSNEVLGEGELDLPATQLRTTGYWISLEPWTLNLLREKGQWTGDPNNYGSSWNSIRKVVLQRDRYTCQSCGAIESRQPFHVHHKIPFRLFTSPEQANQMSNLVTLCPACHKKAEVSILIRSGLAGLSYVLQNLSTLFVMCDISDLGAHYDPLSPLANKQPTVVLYDMIPAGIGLSEALYDMHDDLLHRALEFVSNCGCHNGCPSCVGPAGINGIGGKGETQSLLSVLCGTPI